MYQNKQFTVKKEEDVFAEIDAVSKIYLGIRKIFLADGNPMVLAFPRMMNILNSINKNFPKLRRVTTYAMPENILSKTKHELIALREAGLKMIYVGIESGDDEVLKLINKGETFDSTVKGLLLAKEAGIKLSVIILNGVGGLKYSRQHAINSAKILNVLQPEYASLLVLSFPFGVERYKTKFAGEYIPMSTLDILKEVEIFLSHCELKATIFRSNHASNYLVLNGILSKDKQILLHRVRTAISNPETANLRQEWQRGL